MKWYRLLTAVFIATIAVFATMPASSFAASDEPNSLSSEERSLLRSDAPKNIVMDTATGQVLDVTLAGDMSTMGVVPGSCYGPPRQPCYNGPTIAQNVQFANSVGKVTGSWSNRTGFASGAYYQAKACWRAGGAVCSTVWIPVNSNVYFNNPVTGTSFAQR